MKKPFRPKSEIKPIHVEELLSAAGMSHFLGVLSSPEPVPHLRRLVESVDRVAREALQGPVNDAPLWEGVELLSGFTEHAELLVAEMAKQQETLLAILTRAKTMNRSAAWLHAAIRCRSDAEFRSGISGFTRTPFCSPVTGESNEKSEEYIRGAGSPQRRSRKQMGGLDRHSYRPGWNEVHDFWRRPGP